MEHSPLQQVIANVLEGRTQHYTSARTARRQVPAAFKTIDKLGGWRAGAINLDVGGGPWDLGTEFLSYRGVRSFVWDPYNRSADHNVDAIARSVGAHTATLCNVLNVIAEPWARADALRRAACGINALAGVVWIDVYEGNRSGKGAPSPYGWQEHRPLASYLPEVLEVFGCAEIVRGHKIIRATRPR